MTVETRISKSERTRRAILAAARETFAEKGFDGATIRAIAARAGADPALVVRYFGGKERLFATAVDIDLALPDFASVPQHARGKAMIRHFLAIWEDPRTGPALKTLLKTAAANPEVAARIREVFSGQVMPALAPLGPEADLPVRSALVSSQLLGLALARYVLELQPVAGMDSDRVEAAWGPALQHLIAGPAA